MGLDDGAGDGQTQAGVFCTTFAARRVDPVETVEQPLAYLWRNRRALVGHVDA